MNSASIALKAPPSNRRNYGIDFVRIISMLFICLIHMNFFTQAHKELIPGKEHFYYWGVITQSIGYAGVNLYALITGYICIKKSWNISRYLALYLQVIFYTLILTLIGMLLSYCGILELHIPMSEILQIILSLGAGSPYWYFAAYSALFLIFPFLNKFLLSLSRKEYSHLLIIILCILLPISLLPGRSSIFESGCDSIWLTILYMLGAYLQLYPPNFHKSILVGTAIVCTSISAILYAGGHADVFFHCSPLMVLYSASLFLLSVRLSFNNTLIKKILTYCAPTTFGVYLIHVHPLCFHTLNEHINQLNNYLDYPCWITAVGSLSIFIICTLIDHLRIKLFASIKIPELCSHIQNRLKTIGNVLINR